MLVGNSLPTVHQVPNTTGHCPPWSSVSAQLASLVIAFLEDVGGNGGSFGPERCSCKGGFQGIVWPVMLQLFRELKGKDTTLMYLLHDLIHVFQLFYVRISFLIILLGLVSTYSGLLMFLCCNSLGFWNHFNDMTEKVPNWLNMDKYEGIKVKHPIRFDKGANLLHLTLLFSTVFVWFFFMITIQFSACVYNKIGLYLFLNFQQTETIHLNEIFVIKLQFCQHVCNLFGQLNAEQSKWGETNCN